MGRIGWMAGSECRLDPGPSPGLPAGRGVEQSAAGPSTAGDPGGPCGGGRADLPQRPRDRTVLRRLPTLLDRAGGVHVLSRWMSPTVVERPGQRPVRRWALLTQFA